MFNTRVLQRQKVPLIVAAKYAENQQNHRSHIVAIAQVPEATDLLAGILSYPKRSIEGM